MSTNFKVIWVCCNVFIWGSNGYFISLFMFDPILQNVYVLGYVKKVGDWW